MPNQAHLEKAIVCFADPSRRSEYFNIYSENAVLHGYQGLEPGLRNIKRFYQYFWHVFPDARVTIQGIVEAGDVLAVHYLTTGTQRHMFMGVAPTGQNFELPGMSFLHFREGRCFERWVYSDSQIMLNQLQGAVKSSA